MYYALTYLIKICKYLFKKFKNGTTTEFWHCSLMEFSNAFFCFYRKFSQKINFYGQVGNKNIVKIGIKWKFLKWIKNEVWVLSGFTHLNFSKKNILEWPSKLRIKNSINPHWVQHILRHLFLFYNYAKFI